MWGDVGARNLNFASKFPDMGDLAPNLVRVWFVYVAHWHSAR